tara:strand:- start:1082 stop:1228 length:147 start_codon:yes stop_codon:yes gene_type:complete
MKNIYIVYIVWLILVILWNFIFPDAKPIYDVLAAVVLSAFSNQLNKFI